MAFWHHPKFSSGTNAPGSSSVKPLYQALYDSKADVYAVQGYDSAQLLAIGLNAVKGDLAKRAELIKAMAAAKIDSPRGPITLSSSHNVVQDFYLRKVENGENNSIAVAAKALADPGRGCKMG